MIFWCISAVRRRLRPGSRVLNELCPRTENCCGDLDLRPAPSSLPDGDAPRDTSGLKDPDAPGSSNSARSSSCSFQRSAHRRIASTGVMPSSSWICLKFSPTNFCHRFFFCSSPPAAEPFPCCRTASREGFALGRAAVLVGVLAAGSLKAKAEPLCGDFMGPVGADILAHHIFRQLAGATFPRRRRAGPGGARSGPWATRPKRLWSILACWSPWARPHGAARPSCTRKPAPSAAGRAARRAARRTPHFCARGRIAAARGMPAQPYRCAGGSQRALRWHPSQICSAGPRAARDSGAQRGRPAAQRRRAGSGAPGSGCGRGLDGLQRGAPPARALSASCRALRPAVAGRGGRH